MGHTSEAAQHDDGNQGHAHDEWIPVPAEYADRRGGALWSDHEAAERGEQLFMQNCQVCHGDSGDGSGVAAASLAHKPANLTRHLHRSDGSNDGYLFWRISEGGTTEPFRSMNSTMPAFKLSLSEAQIWDILAFVHNEFHQGFVIIGTGMQMHAEPDHGGADDDHDKVATDMHMDEQPSNH